MRAFFDSSGLAKRYIKERGSEKVTEILSSSSEVAVSLVCPPEIVSALNRLRHQDFISSAQYKCTKKAHFADIGDMTICNITIPIVSAAIALIEKYPLRTLDALHVACAIEWQADLFVSADRRQLSAAKSLGLHVRPV